MQHNLCFLSVSGVRCGSVSGVYFVIFAVLAASQMWVLMVFLRTRNCSVLGYSSLDFLDILDIYHRKDIRLDNIFRVIGLWGEMGCEVRILVNTDDGQEAKMALVAQGASDSRLYFDNTAESVFVRWNLILNDNRSCDFGFVTEIVIAHVACHSPDV